MKHLVSRIAIVVAFSTTLISCGQAIEPDSQLSAKNKSGDGRGKGEMQDKDESADESAGMSCKVVSINHKVCTDSRGRKWDCTRGSDSKCVPEGEI